jgi:uncharacterized protein (TIGR03083 family)
MTLPRETAVAGMVDEYAAFADLLQDLSDEEWQRPTRCAGWRVADVAAHVTAQLTDVVNFRLDGLGSPEVTARQVEDRRANTQAELVDELVQSAKLGAEITTSFDDAAWEAPGPAGAPGTLGFGVEALWYDAWLHADDIRDAVGRPSVRSAGLRAAVSHVAQTLTDQEWAPATLRLEGVEEFPVSGGGGRVVEGDALDFVLVATGRGDPATFRLDETVNIYR